MKKSLCNKLMLIVFMLFMLCPVSSVSAEAPNVMDELMPQTDLPQTNAPLLRYDEVPLENYDIDIYNKDDEGSHWYDSINIFKVDEKIYDNIAALQQQILSGIWYGYLVVVNFGIFLMEQAFTFDIIDSMLSYISTFIAEAGGSYGIGQFMGFMMIMVAGWLVYSFAKRQYRATLSGLIAAAVLSAVFTVYVQNSDQLLGQLNNGRNALASAVLGASTYSLGNDSSKERSTEDQANTGYTNEDSVRYGLSQIRNLMHDLLIVKPYLLLEFGTTNYGVIGGGKTKSSTPEQIKAGKEEVKKLLSKKPGSNERTKLVQKSAKDSLFAPEHTNKRIVLSLLIWIPALVILAMVGYLATFIQIYGVGFLLTAITGVFVLFLSIFPTLRSFAKQFTLKLLGFLMMCVGLTVLLVLLFSFVNITYKVASEHNWTYAQITVAVLIIVAALFALQKQLFGYKIYNQYKQQVKQAWREKVDAITYRDQQRQYARVEPFYTGSNVHSASLASQPGTTDSQIRRRMQETMEKQSNKPTLRRNQPIEQASTGTDNTRATNKIRPFRKSQTSDKQTLSNENGVIPNPHKNVKGNDESGNHNKAVSDQMVKQQRKNQNHAPLKAQPKSPEQQASMNNNNSTSGVQNEQVMKKMRQQDNQEHAPIKQQPQQETSSNQSSKVIEQMRKQEARTEQQKAPIQQPKRPLVPTNGEISTKQFNQEKAPLKAQPQSPQNQQFEKQIRRHQAQQEIQEGKEQVSTSNESNKGYIDRSKELEQMRRQSQQK
ncbi:TrbL/VirB6 plasmid conjugal transfer protein [Priestia megaterium]|nr:TrbL/VirB6 plasmid conjugal transfer protein [Priestia megaterium]